MPLPADTNVKVNSIVESRANTEPSFNRIGLFTKSQPIIAFTNDFKSYTSATAVAQDFGSASSAAMLAEVMFEQEPNVVQGGGSLVIYPMQGAVEATSGKATTIDLTPNLATLQAVVNGSLNIDTTNGSFQANSLNFTALGTTASDFFSNLLLLLQAQKAFVDLDITLDATSGYKFVFTAKTYGLANMVNIVAASPLPSGAVDLFGATYFDGANEVAIIGTASSGQTVVQAITASGVDMGITAFFTDLQQEDSGILANGVYAQGTQQLIYMQAIRAQSQLQAGGVAQNNINASQYLSRLVYYSLPNANNIVAAYLGWFYSTTAINAKITVNQKTLLGVVADQTVNSNIKALGNLYGFDSYGKYTSGSGIVSSNWNGAGWQFNVAYNSAYIAFRTQEVIDQELSANGGGVAADPDGIERVLGTLRTMFIGYRGAGFIAKGVNWNGTPPFGANPTRFKTNFFNNGFVIQPANFANQVAADRQTRTAQVINIAYQLNGAIEGLTLNLYAKQ